MARSTARDTHLSSCNAANSASMNLSGRSNNATLSRSSEAVEATVFGETMRFRVGDGIQDWELSISGFFDGAASNIGDYLNEGLSACVNLVYGPQGSGTGQAKLSGCSILQDYEISGELEGAVEFSATFVAAGDLSASTF